jgi:hypothetical protein
MPLPGDGFIALWNDVAPSRADYDAWHTVEHVPERMTVDGFLRAYRYVLSEGVLPRYFTLYALDNLAALGSEAYLRMIAEPTDWTRSMRPDLRNFIRYVCRTQITRGGGVGGFAAIGLIGFDVAVFAATICERLLEMDGVSGVHFGTIDPYAEALRVAVDKGALSLDPYGIIVLEGYEERALRSSCEALDRVSIKAWSYYKLAFEISKADLSESSFPEPPEGVPAHRLGGRDDV